MWTSQIHSFDVFDTCLCRVSGQPSSVFHLMARTVYGPQADRTDLFEFVNARMKAEREARKLTIKGEKEDVSLGEIYGHFELDIPGYSRDKLLQLELETEASVLRPVQETLEMVNTARKRNAKVIFVTDIYLPGSFVRSQLERYGFLREEDALYVSSEVGLMKVMGSMFDHVCAREGVSPSAIRHYGDNEYADLIMPGKKGIKASLISYPYNRYEKAWNNAAYGITNAYDIYMMSGISRSVRLNGAGSVHDALVLNGIAAAFVPFVAWTLEDARMRGLDKLYFQARDGYLLFEIAKILGERYPDIELRYLYGSRRAFYLAGLKDGSEYELRWAFPPVLGRTPRQMLKRISMDESTLVGGLRQIGLDETFLDRPMDKVAYEQFIAWLLLPESNRQIMTAAETRLSLVRDYFAQEGLLTGKPALVDIGWSRFSQRAVNNILHPVSAFGYFFGVFEERLGLNEGGPYAAAFYPEEFGKEDENKDLLTQSFLPILEQFFALTDQQSTIGFTRNGDRVVPVFEEGSPSANRVTYFKRHLELVKVFAREYAKFGDKINCPQLLLRNCGYRSVAMLMNEPEKAEAELFNGFTVDNGVGDPVPIVKSIGVTELLGRNSGTRPIWTEGSYVYSFGARGLRILKLGRKIKTLLRSITN